MTAPTDAYWCRTCECHRTRSPGVDCPVCAPTPEPTYVPPPRMALDPRAPITTSSGEA